MKPTAVMAGENFEFRDGELYLNGLESPADGKNIIRGLIRRGHSDTDIKKIVGGNALDFFRRVMS